MENNSQVFIDKIIKIVYNITMKKVLITTSFVFIAIFSFVNIAFAEYAFDRGNNSLDNTINRSSSEEGFLPEGKI